MKTVEEKAEKEYPVIMEWDMTVIDTARGIKVDVNKLRRNAYIKGHQSALDSIEQWSKKNQRKYNISYKHGTTDSCVHTPQLLTYIQSLKK